MSRISIEEISDRQIAINLRLMEYNRRKEIDKVTIKAMNELIDEFTDKIDTNINLEELTVDREIIQRNAKLINNIYELTVEKAKLERDSLLEINDICDDLIDIRNLVDGISEGSIKVSSLATIIYKIKKLFKRK